MRPQIPKLRVTADVARWIPLPAHGPFSRNDDIPPTIKAKYSQPAQTNKQTNTLQLSFSLYAHRDSHTVLDMYNVRLHRLKG